MVIDRDIVNVCVCERERGEKEKPTPPVSSLQSCCRRRAGDVRALRTSNAF